MENLQISFNNLNPENRQIEIVERKGTGHPDTLADALAEEISTFYSNYCIDRFGVVLHHNLDKLYIGAGWFISGYGKRKMLSPVNVVVNGRISNTMNEEPIDIEEIQRTAIKKYIGRVLPHLDVETELNIITNSTQHTKIPHWFSPRTIKDIPDAINPAANDTSVCVSYYPPTICERLAMELEQFFWVETNREKLPRFNDVGQDIKVMVARKMHDIDITICVPLISIFVPDWESYENRIMEIEHQLNETAAFIVADSGYTATVRVNPSTTTDPKIYMLGTGSCIECGEEGIVGRGNSNSGVISVFRPHSMEASHGKNPQYHTGRVLGYLTRRLSKAIYEKLGVENTVIAQTRWSHPLVPPTLLSIDLSRQISDSTLQSVIETDFINVDYLSEILSSHMAR